jgi:hypothetical protein
MQNDEKVAFGRAKVSNLFGGAVLSRSQTALLGAPRLPCVAGSGLKRIDFGVPVGIKIHAKICPPVFMKLPV